MSAPAAPGCPRCARARVRAREGVRSFHYLYTEFRCARTRDTAGAGGGIGGRLMDPHDWKLWYAGYLRSDEWRARRALVLERAGGVCEDCGQAEPEVVHHLTYARVGREPLEDLVAICCPCHDLRHPDKPPRTVYTRATAPPDLRGTPREEEL